jgi:hypothetical protein
MSQNDKEGEHMKKALRDLLSEAEANRTHEHGKPCPITNKPIPSKGSFYIWTDHSREGYFNSCYACNQPTQGG